MIIREKLTEPLTKPFVKVVVDIERKILAMGCELHIDCADDLIADGSRPQDLWGANVLRNPDRIEFTSFINIRPADSNHSMEITIPEIRATVEKVIKDMLSL